jgi:hypothetical protein
VTPPLSQRGTSVPAVRAATIAAAAMIAQQVGGKATRDALFLSNLGVSELPSFMLLSAVLSLGLALVFSRALGRFSPARVAPAAFLVNGVLFAVEYFVVASSPKAGAVAMFLHVSVAGNIVVSGFWSAIGERFDPHTAKSAVARIAAGAAFGGFAGGVAAERVAALLTMQAMLLVLCALSSAAALALFFLGKAVARVQPEAEPARSAIAMIKGTRYLRDLGVLVGLTAVVSAIVDYVFKAEAAQTIGKGESLMSFFAVFYTTTGLLTFAVQSTLSKKALKRFGLGGTVALLPGAVFVTAAASVFNLGLATVTALRGVDAVLENSLFRSGYELFYTPLPARRRRAAKTLIDVASDRLGSAAGSVLVLGALALLPVAAHQSLIGLAVVGSAAALGLALKLHNGYVEQLAESLRSGAVQLDSIDVVDRTTHRTLAETAVAIDRRQLLAQIAELGERRQKELEAAGEPSESNATRARARSLGQRIDVLASDNPAEAMTVLQSVPFDHRLTAHVIPLLAKDVLAAHASGALKGVATRITGQLVDALLDLEQPEVVRRRLPAILKSSDDARAVDGLFRGLRDPHFEVRFRCGQALFALRRRGVAIELGAERVFAAAEHELESSERLVDSHTLSDGLAEGGLIDEDLRERVHHGLEHIFTLLGLSLDPAVLLLCLRAVFSDDQALRGTALEYLENVLPAGFRRRLWPYLGARALSRAPRPRQQVLDELLKSGSLEIDRSALDRAPRS